MNTSKIIQNILRDRVSNIREDLENTIAVKASDLLESKKAQVAKSMFNSLDEAWGVSNAVHPSKKGMFDGRSQESIRKERDSFHNKKTRTEAESTKLKELNFALRAKTGWGKVSEEPLDETLPSDATASDYINDFVHSKNKKFSGDSKKQRIHRALGAYYGQHNEENLEEEKEQVEFDPIKARKLIDYHDYHRKKDHYHLKGDDHKRGDAAYQHILVSTHHLDAIHALEDSLSFHRNGHHDLALSRYNYGLKLSKKAKAHSAKLK